MRLRAPVLIAAGCAGDATPLAGAPWLSELGGVVTHSLTARPRRGRATPRLLEATGGVLYDPLPANRGLDATLDRAWRIWEALPAPVIVNVAPEEPSELAAMLEACGAIPAVAAVELNVDLAVDSVDAGSTAAALRRLLVGPLALSNVPVFVKLAPSPAIEELAQIAAGAGADAVVVGHGWPAARADARSAALLEYRLGGPAIRSLTLAAVERAASACELPVIACGGVCTAEAAVAHIAAGAVAVQVGSGQLRDPETAVRVARELAAGRQRPP